MGTQSLRKSAPEVASLGVSIPNTGSLPLTLGIDAMSRAAETAGAQSLWVSDHLLMVRSHTGRYPYSRNGRITWSLQEDYFEALVCCSFIAAATTKARVGTAVLVLPQRNILEVSKVTASIDRLSRGRFVFGVGVGWNAPEMEALGYTFANRGDRMSEMIQALRSCWTGQPESFIGNHVRLDDQLILFPTPAQDGGPPVLVGGMSRAALERAAQLGDGWLALTFADRFDKEDLSHRLGVVQGLRQQIGEGARFKTVIKVHTKPDEDHLIPQLVSETQAIGFDEIIIQPPWAKGIEAATEAIGSAIASLTST